MTKSIRSNVTAFTKYEYGNGVGERTAIRCRMYENLNNEIDFQIHLTVTVFHILSSTSLKEEVIIGGELLMMCDWRARALTLLHLYV